MIKITINPKYINFSNYINSIATNGVQRGDIIYNARNKIYRDIVDDADISIKCFRKPSFFNRIIYTFFRKSKARRSYENATKLTEINVGTPTPIAYIERYKNGLLENSFYICSMLQAHDIRNWDRIENCDKIIERTAQFMAEIHAKGVFHKDFSPGNILYDNDFNFYLIDINRMKFDVTDRHLLMQNFKCLHDSPEETARIAQYYAKSIAANNEKEVIDEALEARSKYKAQQARKRRFKKLFKRSK